MVTFNNGSLVPAAVTSLREHTAAPFEVIVVDNASTDDSVDHLRSLDDIVLVEEERNHGFGAANNIAAARAVGRYICLLNPDARVCAGWLPPLLTQLQIEGAGAAGPVLVDEAGVVREAGAVVDHWGMTGARGRPDFEPPIAVPSQPAMVDYVSAACMVLPSTVFHEVGGFDHAYRLAYYEDVDLCFRMWSKGFAVWCVPDSRAVHIGGAGSDRSTADELWHRNRSVFLVKWKTELRSRPAFEDGEQGWAALASWRESSPEPATPAPSAVHRLRTRFKPGKARADGR
jgi:O-antigen biosynthesis protein